MTDRLVSTEIFSLVDGADADGVRRLAMTGQLDLAVAEQVSTALDRCVAEGQPVRLDLSRLEFIDSSGIRAVLDAVNAGRSNGADLVQVDRVVPSQVQRVLDLIGVAAVLWPEREQAGGAVSAPPFRSA